MKVTRVGYHFGYHLPAYLLPVMLLSFGFTVASAQCSQATRPEPASPALPSISLQSNPPAKDGESSSAEAAPVRFATGSAITVLEETPLQIITDIPISSRTTRTGTKLPFTVTRDVVVGGILVIPCGARVYGTLVSAKQAGRLAGASNLILQLTELTLDGKSYPLYTSPFKVVGQSKTKPTVNKAATGAAVGALAAAASVPTYSSTDVTTGHTTYFKPSPGDQAKGYAVFAGIGAGVGTAIAASTPPSIAMIPAESQLEFTLASPIAVYPVDQRTAARLAQGMHLGGPVLYVRGENQ